MNELWAAEAGWALDGPDTSARPGQRLRLDHRGGVVPARDVVVRRDGPDDGPVRFGEAVRIEPQDGDPSPFEGIWRLTGGRVGTSVPTGQPVGLLSEATCDHLAATPDGALVGWTTLGPVSGPEGSGGPGDPAHPDPFDGRRPLTVPWAARTIGGVASQVVLHGALRREVRDGVTWAVVVPDDDAVLGDVRRVRLALPEATAAALPPDGTWLLAAGVLVAAPPDGPGGAGVALDPVDGFAWAAHEDGTPLDGSPRHAAWPQVALVWTAVGVAADAGDPRVYAQGPRPVTWYLPLPTRDGEPGSSTTTAAPPPSSGAAAIVRHPVGRSRGLRLAPPPGADVRCTVRIHVRRPSG